jgi:hypothetical protein
MRDYSSARGLGSRDDDVSFAGIPMSEKLSDVRDRTLLAGKLVYDFGQSSIDCIVRRISDRGATLTIESSLGIPEHCHLLIAHDGPPRRCKRVWQSGRELGLEFESDETKETAHHGETADRRDVRHRGAAARGR